MNRSSEVNSPCSVSRINAYSIEQVCWKCTTGELSCSCVESSDLYGLIGDFDAHGRSFLNEFKRLFFEKLSCDCVRMRRISTGKNLVSGLTILQRVNCVAGQRDSMVVYGCK